jgi:hypothetical protein
MAEVNAMFEDKSNEKWFNSVQEMITSLKNKNACPWFFKSIQKKFCPYGEAP